MTKEHDLRTVKIAKLKDHPLHTQLFGDLPPHELDALAADLAERGLQHPIEILPSGVILAGHQRRRAAQRLGWTEIDTVVRDDLTDDPATADAYVITDNLRRRQLSPFQRVRCIRQLLGQAGRRASEKLKAEIGRQLNLTTRSINRYLLISDTPLEVQQAFDRGDLTLINAGKVALMPRGQQREIAQRIADGELASTVVKQYLDQARGTVDGPGGAFKRLIAAARREFRVLEGRASEIDFMQLHSTRQTLERMQRLIDGLLAEAKERQEAA